MAAMFHGQSAEYTLFLHISNLVFTYIFIAEAVLKLIAQLPRSYFSDSWNRFDFFLVAGSIVDLLLSNVVSEPASVCEQRM